MNYKKVVTRLFQVIMLFIYALIALSLAKVWTSNIRTYQWVRCGLYVLIFLSCIWFILRAFACNKCIFIRKLAGVICLLVFVGTNLALSINAYQIYSFKYDVPIGSAYLPPNGDMPVLVEILEDKKIVLGQKKGHINRLCEMIASECIIDESVRNDVKNYAYVDMGELGGMYRLYGTLFEFEYKDGDYDIPSLYIDPFIDDIEYVVVVEDENYNVRIFAK